jgi:uncharacterized protein
MIVFKFEAFLRKNSHMTLDRISIENVRQVQLAAQGLLEPLPHPAQKQDVLEMIRRMGALQIDTISVVARSPYMVLFSRLGEYQPVWLDELLAEGELFEYWAHAACFLPKEDYPLYRRMMLDGMRGWTSAPQWMQEREALIDLILNRIRAEGPLRSADFERRNGKGSGWWDWKEEKIALERLFDAGIVTIARRDKFQRRYDLTERVIQDLDLIEVPSHEEMVRQLAARALCCLGAAPASWVADYFRLKRAPTARALTELINEGQLIQIAVEGWEEPVLVHIKNTGLLEQAAAGQLNPTLTALLSPFDPLVWDRSRVKALFDFEFTIECYLPAEKRRYGYYLLPILHQGELVGRLDAKAHRKEGLFEIKALYLEPHVSPTAELGSALSGAIQRAADWHHTPKILTGRVEPLEFADLLAGIEISGVD